MIWLSALFKVLLATQPWLAFIIVLVFDIPRDTLSFVITGSHRFLRRFEQRRIVDDADIAVVIPALNSPSGLLTALHTLGKQTIRPRQVIAIDDGSSDETGAVLKLRNSRFLFPMSQKSRLLPSGPVKRFIAVRSLPF